MVFGRRKRFIPPKNDKKSPNARHNNKYASKEKKCNSSKHTFFFWQERQYCKIPERGGSKNQHEHQNDGKFPVEQAKQRWDK